jgi:hypothetical protein
LNEFEILNHFGDFFKTLSRSVYLSLEGFFLNPEKCEEETEFCQEFIDINDFEFEMNEVSAFEELT